jgi:2-polyprenyl-3-methyl-5-hydroxy-6-metoxy-1,4-benzoquinol methylase
MTPDGASMTNERLSRDRLVSEAITSAGMDADRERWNTRWAARGGGRVGESSLIQLVDPWLPESGRAVDVAGGGSGDGVRLAERGLDVTVADISDTGLELSEDMASEAGVSVTTAQVDLESDRLPPGPWNVITMANYCQRSLFGRLVGSLEPGGVLAVVIATMTNLERSPRPSAARLLDADEILSWVTGLEVVDHSEAWRANDRHEAWLVGRR